MRGIVLIFLFFSFASIALDDTTAVIKDSIAEHSVKKAVIYSAILAGAGQVYNHLAMPKRQKKAFWKVPLIYAGLGASTYFLITNQLTQRELKDEYTQRIDNQISSAKWAAYDDPAILILYNQYLNWRDLSILAVGAAYFFQVIDAGIEAHFVSFDVSEDLSMTIEPTLVNYKTAGIRMTLNFR